jgi:hypothetical protein
MCPLLLKTMILHLHWTFIASSYFIEVLGGKNVGMGMPKFLGRFGESRSNLFQSRGTKKCKIVDKISSRLGVLKRDGVKIVLLDNNL